MTDNNTGDACMQEKPLSLDELDTACQARWREGDLQACHQLAQRLLDRAREVDDTLMQSQGLLHLARCALRTSQYLATVELAEQAGQLLRLDAQVDAEVEALALACNALTALRRFDEAIAAGQRALLLSQEADHPLSAVVAADPLGLALAWAGQLDASLDRFTQGLACARALGRADWVAHLSIHRACATALAIALARDESDDVVEARALDQLDRVVEEALARCERSPGVPNAVTQRPGRFLLGWVQVLQACWSGRPAIAQALLAQIRPLVHGERGWLDLLALCASAEVARVQGRLEAAADTAAAVVCAGLELSHLALADLGAGLLSRVRAEQGRHDLALQVERERARRLRQARVAALEGLVRVARADLAVRSRQQVQAEALRRPIEDPLTGLADRTQFVQRCDALLRREDVDRSRCAVVRVALRDAAALAAGHGPLVRDRALCAVAALLRRQLRVGDLPARWSHDEFAILLHRSGPEESARIADRIATAVRGHEGSTLLAGVALDVVTGYTLLRSGDTVSTLMRRSEDMLASSRRLELRAA